MEPENEQEQPREFFIPTALWPDLDAVRDADHREAIARADYEALQAAHQYAAKMFWSKFRKHLMEAGLVKAQPEGLHLDLERGVVYTRKPDHPMADLMKALGGK